MGALTTLQVNCRIAIRSLRRPYPVSAPMIVLIALVPLYIFIAEAVSGGPVHRPALALDQAIPFVPAWGLLYGALYFSLIALPILIVRDEVLLRRMFLMYVSVWTAAYVCFVVYPTIAPRPPRVSGNGFVMWGLQFLYSADPPYNCFPSLHVAHSVVSALMCRRVHRRVGACALVCAALVALSTLFTKQHYVLDVVVGAAMACVAYVVLLRGTTQREITGKDHRAAPVFAGGVLAVAAAGVTMFWIVYRLSS